MDISVALNKRGYLPGEVVKVLVKAQRHAPPAGGPDTDTSSTQLTVECFGSEKVDPGWVHTLYQPQLPAHKDAKRLVRTVFTTGQLQLFDGDRWPPGAAKAFTLRFRLPNKIPPTFRGSAVHYQYQVQVKGAVVPGPGATAKAAPTHAQSNAPFRVWPKAERPAGGGAGGGLDGRRASLQLQGSTPLSPTLLGAGSLGASAASALAAAAAGGGAPGPAAAGSAADGAGGDHQHQQDLDLLEYRLGISNVKAQWEEVAVLPDGSLQRLDRRHHAQQQQQHRDEQQQPDAGQQQQQQPSPRPSGGVGGYESSAGDGDDSLLDDPPHPASGVGGGRLSAQQRASMMPRTFNLRAGDYPLVRVTLQPPMDAPLQPGATVGVFLDLRAAHGPAADPSVQPSCLQVAALLQSEEEVHAPYAARGNKASAAPDGSGGICAMRTLYVEQQQTTAHLLTSHFTLSVPSNAHPSFRTPLVTHRWTLRFELTLGVPGKGGGGKRGTEQLVWSLPLVVCPPCS